MALRLAILGSGKGSNCGSILKEIADGTLDAEMRVILSDHEDAGILDLARERGIRAEFIRPGNYKTWLEPEIEQKLVAILLEEQVEYVILAGYMRLVKAKFLEAFPNRIINIHPSLLPAFPGLASWKQALEAGVDKAGCTVHYVDAGMDTGPIIAQAEVPVLPDDTAESLHARIQIEEHKIYPAVIRKLADER